MAIGLQISEEDKSHYTILRARGRIDASSSPILERKISGLLDKGRIQVLVDFSDVEYLSSAGLRLMLSATKKIKALGGRLIFFGLENDVTDIIKMAGFERILDIYANEKDAAHALKT